MEYHNLLHAVLEILNVENILPKIKKRNVEGHFLFNLKINKKDKLLVLKQLFQLQIHRSKELHVILLRDQFFLQTKK